MFSIKTLEYWYRLVRLFFPSINNSQRFAKRQGSSYVHNLLGEVEFQEPYLRCCFGRLPWVQRSFHESHDKGTSAMENPTALLPRAFSFLSGSQFTSFNSTSKIGSFFTKARGGVSERGAPCVMPLCPTDCLTVNWPCGLK